jgi:hypothetical protein
MVEYSRYYPIVTKAPAPYLRLRFTGQEHPTPVIHFMVILHKYILLIASAQKPNSTCISDCDGVGRIYF